MVRPLVLAEMTSHMNRRAAVDDDEESQDVVSSLCGETVLRECLKVGAATGTYLPQENRDEKTKSREKQVSLF